jgi:hypothetical protein
MQPLGLIIHAAVVEDCKYSTYSAFRGIQGLFRSIDTSVSTYPVPITYDTGIRYILIDH